MVEHETTEDVIAEMRGRASQIMDCVQSMDAERKLITQCRIHRTCYKVSDAKRLADEYNHYADRIEAAWKRERQMIIDEANDDTALVKNCATCKHYCRNKKYCPAQDTVNVNPDILPIFRTGPCDKWKCKYTRMLDWLLAPATEKEGGNDGNE